MLLNSAALAERVYVQDFQGGKAEVEMWLEDDCDWPIISYNQDRSEALIFDLSDLGYSGDVEVELECSDGNRFTEFCTLGEPLYLYGYDPGRYVMRFLDGAGEVFYIAQLDVTGGEGYNDYYEEYGADGVDPDDSGDGNSDQPSSNAPQVGWVSAPTVEISPCIDSDGSRCTIEPVDVEIRWYADGDVQYYVLYAHDAATGEQIVGGSCGLDTRFVVPAGYFLAGSSYEISVGAVPVNGSDSDAVYSSILLSVQEPQPQYVGAPELRVEPQSGYDGMPVVDPANSFEIDWSAENAAAYDVRICDASGAALVSYDRVGDSGQFITAGALPAGVYTVRVWAYASDGTASEPAELTFRVGSEPESPANDEPETSADDLPDEASNGSPEDGGSADTGAPVGAVNITAAPEKYNDGMPVVAKETGFTLSWGADSAVCYEIALADASGNVYLQSGQVAETVYPIPGDALPEGEYVLYVTAWGADGSSSADALNFRIEAQADPSGTADSGETESDPSGAADSGETGTDEPEPQGAEPAPEQTAQVGQPYVRISPEKYNDGMPVVAQESDYAFEWGAENAAAYGIELSDASGYVYLAADNTGATYYPVPGGALPEGEYVLTITAWGADGSSEQTAQRFRVESGADNTSADNTGADNTGADDSGADNTSADNTSADNTGADHSGADDSGETGTDEPEPQGAEPAPEQTAQVGQPYVRISPEKYNDGMPVVAQESDYAFEWGAENAVAYGIELSDASGYVYLAADNTGATYYPVPGGALPEGEYVLTITAWGADGSSEQTAQPFRVEAELPEVTPTPTLEVTPTPTPEITPTPTPEITPTPEVTPTPEITPTPEVTPTPEITPTPTPEVTPTPEITSTPEPAQVGEVRVAFTPNLSADDVPAAPGYEDFTFEWSAENAVSYGLKLEDANGYVYLEVASTSATAYPVPAGALPSGDYLLTVTATGEAGSTSERAQSFRVIAPETPSPAPETPTPVPETPSPAPETPSPAPETPTPVPETPSPVPEDNTHTDTPVPEDNTHSDTPVPEDNTHTDTPVPEDNTHSDTPVPEDNTHSDTPVPQSDAPRTPTAPRIFANNRDVTGGSAEFAQDAVTNLSWSADVADSYIVELLDERGGVLLNRQTGATSMNLTANELTAGVAYTLRVSAAVAGGSDTASAEVRVSVQETPADAELAVWLNSVSVHEGGVSVVSAASDLDFGWSLTGDDLRVTIVSETTGATVYDSSADGGAAGLYGVRLSAGALAGDAQYRLRVELPGRSKSAELSFCIRAVQLCTVTPTPDANAGLVKIAITPVDGAGEYRTLSGAGLMPQQVYTVPANATVAVEMSAEGAEYPTCSLKLYNYSTQALIQSAEGTAVQRWSVDMRTLSAGDVYILEVTPDVPGEAARFLFSAEAEPIAAAGSGEFRLWFSGNSEVVTLDLAGTVQEARAFDQVQNLLLRWTDVPGTDAYDLNLYRRVGSGRQTIYSAQVSDSACLLDAGVAGLAARETYEVEVRPVGGSRSARMLFLFRDGAGSGTLQLNPTPTPTIGPKSSTGAKPVMTLPPNRTPKPTTKPIATLLPSNRTDTSAPDAISTLSTLTALSTLAPLALNTDGEAEGGAASGSLLAEAELQVDVDPLTVAKGASAQLQGKITSTVALDSVQLCCEGSVVFEKQSVNASRFNLNEFTIDTASDAAWQNREGEVTLEAYVTYDSAAVSVTAAPTGTALPTLQNLGQTIALPTLPPLGLSFGAVDAPAAAADSDRHKLGDIKVYIEPQADAFAGAGAGLQLSVYEMDAALNRGAKRSISAVESGIDYSWTAGSMDVAGNDVTNTEIKWDGWVQAKYTDRVRFEVYATNGVRLTVNGQQCIDDWSSQPVRTCQSSWINVTAGEKYVISLDNFQLDAGGELKLSWEYESHPGEKETIPAAYLYSVSDALLGADAIANAVAQYGLTPQQENALNYAAMLSGDDRYSDAIIAALDAGEPIVFLLEGAGATTAAYGGSLHAQGRMDAMLAVVYNGAVELLSTCASTLPDVPRAGATVMSGAVEATFESLESTSGPEPHLKLGAAAVLRCVDGQCGYCGAIVSGTGVWHVCSATNHGLEIVPASPWALTAADAQAGQGLTLDAQDFAGLAKLAETTGKVLVIVDRQSMDPDRLDYEWLYDNLGLAKLLP